jgi:hypothetical protein
MTIKSYSDDILSEIPDPHAEIPGKTSEEAKDMTKTASDFTHLRSRLPDGRLTIDGVPVERLATDGHVEDIQSEKGGKVYLDGITISDDVHVTSFPAAKREAIVRDRPNEELNGLDLNELSHVRRREKERKTREREEPGSGRS